MYDILKHLCEIGCQINWEYVIAILTIIGSTLAIICSVITSKKQRTADIVTKNRMEWIQSLRNEIGDYYAKVKLFEDKQKPDNISEFLNDLYLCEAKIKLQLNCFGKYDATILRYISELNRSYDAFLHKVTLYKRIKNPVQLTKEMLEYIATYHYELLEKTVFQSISKNNLQSLLDEKKYDELFEILNKEEIAHDNFLDLFRMEKNYVDDCCKIIRGLADVIIIYVQIYLKVEWERVKLESQKGNLKHFDFDERFSSYLIERSVELEKIKMKLPEYLFE